MTEANVNTEIARHLDEQAREHQKERRHEMVEILEAALLALVAIVTAWSGYQAARWDGESAREYASSSRLRIQSEQLYLTSNQTLSYNAGTFNAWLQAKSNGDKKLAALMVRRFTPEYRSAFNAWIALDPLHNKDAPPGPRYMPQYKDPLAEKSAELSKEASHDFDLGVTSRETGEKFVRVTVILAAVLFLIAMGQRFEMRSVRVGVLVVAAVFLTYGIVLIAMLPRA